MTLDAGEGEPADDLYAGDLIVSSKTTPKLKRSKGSKVAFAVLKGVATVVSLGVGGIYLRQQAAKKRRKKQAQEAQNPHESFTCSSCCKNQRYSDSELRYMCG